MSLRFFLLFSDAAQLTHPETARWAQAVPSAITIAALLSLTLLLRGRLLFLLQRLLTRWMSRSIQRPIDPALQWTPPITTPARLLLICLVAALLVIGGLGLLGALYLGLLLAGPVTALLIWLQLWVMEQRYRRALDSQLPAAVSRLAARLASGSGVQTALAQVVADLPAGALRAEWGYLLSRQGVPLSGGSLATMVQVTAVLAECTPSGRHRALLGHLEVAVEQSHDVLVRRMTAAAEALYAAERRRSAAATELAQMRYSGLAVGLAGLAMALYLGATQFERVAIAYGRPAGVVVGLIVGLALFAPLVGGVLLSQVDDADY